MNRDVRVSHFLELGNCDLYGCRVVMSVSAYYGAGRTVYDFYDMLDCELGADNWRLFRIEKRERAYIDLRNRETLQRARLRVLLLYNPRQKTDFKLLSFSNKFKPQKRRSRSSSSWTIWVSAHIEEPGLLRRRVIEPDFDWLYNELDRRLDGSIDLQRTDEVVTVGTAANARVFSITTTDPVGSRRAYFIVRNGSRALFVNLLRFEKA